MRARGNQVGKAEHRRAAAFEPPALHRTVVTRDGLHRQPRNDFVIVVLHLQLARLRKRPPVLRQITRSIAFRRLFRMFPFSARNEVTCVGKRRHDLTVGVERRVAAGMVEMQMRVENDGDVFGQDARLQPKRLGQRTLPIDAVKRRAFAGPLVADARLDQYLLFSGIDEHAVHIHTNAVLVVRRKDLRPQIARNDAEHRPAVETKFGVLNNPHSVIADLHVAAVSP